MENQIKTPLSPSEKNGKVPHAPEYLLVPGSTQADEDSGKLLEALRRKIPLIAGVTAATTAAAWAISWDQRPTYESGFQLLIEPVSVQNQQDRDPLGSAPSSNQDNISYETQIAVLKSAKLLQPIAEQIAQRYPEIARENFAEKLTIERPADTKLIQVSYRDSDPDRIKFVLDKLAEGYLRYSQKERESNLSYGIAFVDRQIGETRKRVDNLQRQLQAFRQQNNFIAPESLAGQVTGQVQSIAQQKLQTDREIAEMRRQYGNLQGSDGARAALAADGAYQGVLNKLRDLEAKIATESTRFQGDTVEMRALQQQRASLVPVLRQEAQRVLGNQLSKVGSDLSVLETRRQVLDRADAYWNGEVQRLPVLTRIFTDLDRERTVATESLTRLLGTRENLQVQAAQKDIPWQLITPPVRPNQAMDSPQRNIILGALAGLLLGSGAALLSDRLDRRVRRISDIKRLSKLPVLGVIPYEVKTPEVLKDLQIAQASTELAEGNAFTEAFRSLYTNLRLLNTDHPVRSLVVSSATPGDGKTTVALHLAQAAAAMGQRVLLVDADLRHPEIAERLEITNSKGLTELVAQSLNPQDVIQRLEALVTVSGGDEPMLGRTNFSILTSGKMPLDPTRLLSSQKMQRLNDYFKAMYDLVIFDAPPLLSYADSSLLATYTNGMLVVAGMGKTDQADLRQMLDTLQTARVPVLGIVATCSNAAAVED
ncbi:tyrosine-protein kinase family protein [Leptolyngbya sp. FACHB-17]|uniref:GumC family protein n=1 Tax=unclassified Leptolyngbya TaxID=2650499 RepID=UPI0016800EE2|nr:tyrosine-protein kinase family protein [Leptolyngbya sp. FACHB-17]MBD2081878.1 AAA family ATPase [Leptolyngbya sp. FACHB-17]